MKVLNYIKSKGVNNDMRRIDKRIKKIDDDFKRIKRNPELYYRHIKRKDNMNYIRKIAKNTTYNDGMKRTESFSYNPNRTVWKFQTDYSQR